MRKDKILLIFGFILVISGIAGVILSDNGVSFRILLNIGIVIIINGFILKYKLDSGKVYIDERILKISYKSIALSWFTTLILTGFLIVLMQFKIVTSLTSFQAVSLIFTTMTITYIFSLFSYRNKKI